MKIEICFLYKGVSYSRELAVVSIESEPKYYGQYVIGLQLLPWPCSHLLKLLCSFVSLLHKLQADQINGR